MVLARLSGYVFLVDLAELHMSIACVLLFVLC